MERRETISQIKRGWGNEGIDLSLDRLYGLGRVATDDLPNDIRSFILMCIDSVEQLRVLLLLQADPQRTWTIPQITNEIRSTEASIKKRLDDLYSRNVLTPPIEAIEYHKFSPSSPELSELIGRLAEVNRTKPYRIIEAIYTRQSEALQAFADAFKLRGNKS